MRSWRMWRLFARFWTGRGRGTAARQVGILRQMNRNLEWSSRSRRDVSKIFNLLVGGGSIKHLATSTSVSWAHQSFKQLTLRFEVEICRPGYETHPTIESSMMRD